RQRTSHHPAVDNHAVINRTCPDNHTVVDPADHDGPSARDDDGGARATRDHPTLDTAATSPSALVERQHTPATRVAPDSRAGLQPLDVWTPRLGQQG
ncbi:MAG: hypothetical protein JO045_16740, partial [Mycobacterium sp.]|nr:hypothetical protein [Mycobacterium sp.]